MLILGNRKSILGGSSATWQYGPSGELTDVRNASFTGATISRYAYTYDATLRRIAVAKSGRAFATEDDISYGYNYRSELTNATAQADAAYRYAYDFDDIGNRKTSAEHAAPSVSYTANSLNQYTAIDDFVPTYDADGNQTLVKTKTGIWHVTYNGENRPVRWECGTNVITMTYDRMGRRIAKNDQTFIYDGYLQIADNQGSSYIWDPTEPVATRPLVRNNSEFYFHDGNKNVSDILSVTGSLLSHYDYAPFGDCTSVGSNPWRFSSEYSDDDLGLIYYNYRHYDPCAGRWTSRDLIEENGGFNLLGYVQNFAENSVDRIGFYTMKTQLYVNPVFKVIKVLKQPIITTPEAWELIEDLKEPVKELVDYDRRVDVTVSWNGYCAKNLETNHLSPIVDGVKYSKSFSFSLSDYLHIEVEDIPFGKKVSKFLDGAGLSVNASLGFNTDVCTHEDNLEFKTYKSQECSTRIVSIYVIKGLEAEVSLSKKFYKGFSISSGALSTSKGPFKKVVAYQQIELKHCCCPEESSSSVVGGQNIDNRGYDLNFGK